MDDRLSAMTTTRPFHVMTKPNGPSCNLACDYCFYLDTTELYPEVEDFRMSVDTLETYIEQMFEAHPGPVVTFSWQGGEPTLLGIEFFETVIDLQRKHAPSGTDVQNCLQTNGTILDDDWGRFLAENEFLVGISLDGPKRLHDRYRRTRGDATTFDRVMNGLTVLNSHDVEYNVLCVLNAINSRYPIEVYDFFKDVGVEWIQFIPLVEPITDTDRRDGPSTPSAIADDVEKYSRIDIDRLRSRIDSMERYDEGFSDVVETARNASVSDRSVDPVIFGEFMIAIFEKWVHNDVGAVSIRLFDHCLDVVINDRASVCVFSDTCGQQLAMEHNGDVYACDHFVDDGFERGNIHDTHLSTLVESAEQRQFGEYKRTGLPERCRNCPVRSFCNGGCPKNWHLEAPNDESGLNYLCPGYQLFFTHAQPYFERFQIAN